MKTKYLKELLASINEAREIHAGKIKARRITPERISEHIKKHLKNPSFKESYEIERHKLGMMKRRKQKAARR
jgi:hypothetical protein